MRGRRACRVALTRAGPAGPDLTTCRFGGTGVDTMGDINTDSRVPPTTATSGSDTDRSGDPTKAGGKTDDSKTGQGTAAGDLSDPPPLPKQWLPVNVSPLSALMLSGITPGMPA